MERFEIGELCEGQCRDGVWRDVIILSKPYFSPIYKNELGDFILYRVDRPGKTPPPGETWALPPERLRKKKPPREDLQIVRWADCPWQPNRIEA